MFTGLIEEVGNVKQIVRGKQSVRLCISARNLLNDVRVGDSIAVNGVCLTVTDLAIASNELNENTSNTDLNAKNPAAHNAGGVFFADVMHETCNRSSLGCLHTGDVVNLERAMCANGRFGGHIVSGHIDTTGKIVRIYQDDISFRYVVNMPHDYMRYIVEKGSVAIDGISLTVVSKAYDAFEVSIIPHTQKHTNLHTKPVGSVVNVECDVLGKYVESMMFSQGNGTTSATTATITSTSATPAPITPTPDTPALDTLTPVAPASDTPALITPAPIISEDFLKTCGF